MTAKPLPSVLATLGGRASAAPDADLLARFVAGDQPAFAELVRRYARLVWRVARTRCRSESAAEDVFQAAFVVLSRKAASIRSGAALAGWLHRTAHRLAVRAARKERPAVPLTVDPPTSADPLDALTARELLSAVDDELAKLADGERAVLALCGIDGLTNDEAAKRLGTTTGSVKGRLERARAKLRLRLDARGLTLPAVALGLLGGPTATTVQAALAIPLGGAVPPGIERLIAEGLGMSGTFTKATLLLALVGALVVAGGGDGGSANRATAAPVPKEGKDDGLIWTHNTKTGALTAYTPDGKKEKELTLKDGDRFLGLTPDGTKIAFAGKNGKLADPDTGGMTLHLRDISDKTDGTDTGLGYKPGDNFHWSPDGKKVARVRFIADKRVNALFHFHLAYDLTGRKGEEIPPPDNHYLIGWAADGKTWLLHEYVRADLRNPALPRYRVMSMPAGGGDVTPLCDAASLTTFEPADGAAFHGVGNIHKNPADDTDATYRRWFRVSDGRADLVKQFDDFDSIDLRSSPDRKRVAVLAQTGRDEASDTVLLVYDPDGTNEQKLVTLKADGPNTRLLGWFPTRPADARKRNAPVPKKADPERLVVWSEPMNPGKGFAATHGIWTPDGKHVVTGGQVPGAAGGEWPGELRVWDAETGKLVHTHRGELSYVTRPTTVAVTPDGKLLAVAGYGNAQPRRFTLDLFGWGEETPRASIRVNKPLTGVLLAADGKTVFTLDLRGDLTARDVKSEKLLWTTALGQELSWGLAFWNDRKELLVADEGGNVRRFDATTGKELPALGKHDIKALGLSVSKDEKRVAVGGYSGKGPVVLDCKDGLAGEFRSMKLPAGVQANQVSLSPDGTLLAAACSGKENAVKVFNAATGDLLAEGKEHTGGVSGAQFSPDGKRLLTVGGDAIKVWTVSELMKPEDQRAKPDARRRNAPVPKGADKRVVWSEPVRVDWGKSYAKRITGVWMPDGRGVLVPMPTLTAKGEHVPGGGLDIRDAATGKVTSSIEFAPEFKGAAFQPTAQAVSPDGKKVVAYGQQYRSGQVGQAQPGGLASWGDIEKSKEHGFATDAGAPDVPLFFTANGKHFVTVSEDGALEIFDAASGRKSSVTKTGGKGRAVAVADYPVKGSDFGSVAAGTDAGELVMAAVTTGKLQSSVGGLKLAVRTLAVSDNGSIAIGGEAAMNGAALVLLAGNAPEFKNAVPAKVAINGLAFAPDGKHLAAACSDGFVRVFDVTTGTPAAAAKEHAAEVFTAAYSPDGKRLLTVGKDAVKVWDVEELMRAK